MKQTRRRWTLKERGELVGQLEALALFARQTAVKVDHGQNLKAIFETFRRKLKEREEVLEELMKIVVKHNE